MARRLAQVLYNERELLKERTEAEAQGTSFWTTTFTKKVRTRLMYAAREAVNGDDGPLLERARYLILREGNHPSYLNRYGPNVTPAEDFDAHFMECSDEIMPSAIEALYSALESFVATGPGYVIPTFDSDKFGRDVQQVLEQERVAFDFDQGRMRSFKSKELHQNVIEPAMQLLHDPKFSEAEKAYRHALEEVTGGKPGDAITDAGTALQETLKALGCEGKSLGPLIKSAKAKNLLAGHDARMTEAIEDIMVWAAADRNEMGDSHNADKAAKDDAWFIIHVVGALIVRLVGASRK